MAWRICFAYFSTMAWTAELKHEEWFDPRLARAEQRDMAADTLESFTGFVVPVSDFPALTAPPRGATPSPFLFPALLFLRAEAKT